MTTPAERLSEIKGRLEKATPGPWFADLGNWQIETHCEEFYRAGVCDFAPSSRDGCDPFPKSTVDPVQDAEFIAATRDDIPFLLSLLDEAVEMAEFFKPYEFKCREQMNITGLKSTASTSKIHGMENPARAFLAKLGRAG